MDNASPQVEHGSDKALSVRAPWAEHQPRGTAGPRGDLPSSALGW